MFEIQRKLAEDVYRVRPQQVFLREAQGIMSDQMEVQDSLFGQLMKLVSADTLADTQEKMEAIRLLAEGMHGERYKLDSIENQLIEVVLEEGFNLNQKGTAVQLLAKSRTPKAYSFLLNNIWWLSTTDDYNNTTYWFVNQEPIGNWALFPEIIQLMSTKKLEFDEGMVTVTLLLDKIVQDPPLLISLLDLYAQKEQNDVFFENKKNIVQLLQDMH